MIELERRGAIAVVTLARPPVNAISNEWLAAFQTVLDRITPDLDTIRVLHVRSARPVFCAGADLDQVASRFAAADGTARMTEDVAGFHRLFDRVEALPCVTLAEIGGAALGGGLELALSCDLRIAAHDAQLGLPEARLGLIPGAGGTQRLTRLCGRGVAARLILGAEIVDGATARELGLVQWAVARDELPERARSLAESVADLAGPAVRVAKRCIAAAQDPTVDGFALELELGPALIATADARERVAAFLGNRKTSRKERG